MALKRLNIHTTQRTVSSGGAFSPDVWNDTLGEMTTDLAALAKQWNELLVPLLHTIPDGTQDTAVNAYVGGLDGRTFYVHAKATPAQQTIRWYNLPRNRPYTLIEVLENIYSDIGALAGGVSDGDTTIISSGDGLTQAQKEAIGIHVFDISQTSSSISIQGIGDKNVLDLIQLAKDLYGTAFWSLNGTGVGILANSNRAMVDALLELHGGNWDNDITLSHADVIDISSLRSFVGQPSSAVNFPTYSSTVIVTQNANLQTAIGQLDAAFGTASVTLNQAYLTGATAADQTITNRIVDGGTVTIAGVVTSSGVWGGSTPLTVLLGDTTVGVDRSGQVDFKNFSPVASGLRDGAHLAITSRDGSTSTVKDAVQVAGSLFSGGTVGAGFGVALAAGSLTAAGGGGGIQSIGKVSFVLVDAAAATLTAGVSIAAKGENKDIPTWDNGGYTLFNSSVSTSNNVQTTALSIPIPNSTIRVMNHRANIIGATADGLNYASFVVQGAFSTSIGAEVSVTSTEFSAGTGSTWNAYADYAGSNLNVFVSGVNGSTIKWNVGVELFGLIA